MNEQVVADFEKYFNGLTKEEQYSALIRIARNTPFIICTICVEVECSAST